MVTRDPGILGGEPTIRGSRIAVHSADASAENARFVEIQ